MTTTDSSHNAFEIGLMIDTYQWASKNFKQPQWEAAIYNETQLIVCQIPAPR